jgi:CRISPR-associated protein Csd2
MADLKRKNRNYVSIAKEGAEGFNIYVQEKAVLNRTKELAYKAYELKPQTKKLPKKQEDTQKVTGWMCSNFYDIRSFGAVMTTEVNCGRVLGRFSWLLPKVSNQSFRKRLVLLERL